MDWFHHDVITVGWSALGPDGLTWLCRMQGEQALRIGARLQLPALPASRLVCDKHCATCLCYMLQHTLQPGVALSHGRADPAQRLFASLTLPGRACMLPLCALSRMLCLCTHRHYSSMLCFPCFAAAVHLSMALGDWPALASPIGAMGAPGVRLVGVSLAVPPRWRLLPADVAALAQLSKLWLASDSSARGWQLLPRQLQHLDLSNCLLLNVPADLAALTQLSRLSLANNWVAGGWPHLPQQLQQLDLSNCHLRLLQLPAELTALTQLTKLCLAKNTLVAMDGWQHLPRSLRQLDLSNCHLQRVPAQLADLTQLTALSLSCNNEPFRRPEGFDLGSLPRQLQRLELSGCGLRHELGTLAHLTHLTQLRLDSNPVGSAEQWGFLERLQQLQRLHLRRCRVRRVPAVLRTLTQLTSLSLAGNPIQAGWQELPEQLQQLDLEWCGLWRVPAELADLTHLQTLRLDRNHITGGWQQLPRQLRQLMPRGCGPQLPLVLSPLLAPNFWVPVSQFVCNPPVPRSLLLTMLFCFWVYWLAYNQAQRRLQNRDNM